MDSIIQERVRNDSYATRWGQGVEKSALNTSVVYKLCMFIPIHGSFDCAGSSVFSHPLSTVDTSVHPPLTAIVQHDSTRRDLRKHLMRICAKTLIASAISLLCTKGLDRYIQSDTSSHLKYGEVVTCQNNLLVSR